MIGGTASVYYSPESVADEEPSLLGLIPDDISFLPIAGRGARTVAERAVGRMGRHDWINSRLFIRIMGSFFEYELAREFCHMDFHLLVYSGDSVKNACMLSNAEADFKVIYGKGLEFADSHVLGKAVCGMYDRRLSRFTSEEAKCLCSLSS